MNIRFEPLAQFPRPFMRNRRNSPFSAGYDDTVSLLDHEIRQLGGKNVRIMLSIRPEDVRRDGMPRASARAAHPGVVVLLDTRHGSLSFCCDEFHDWQSNLRGIALTLERLRMAGFYGVTKHGEQYAGWRALPPAQPEEDLNTARGAARWLARQMGVSNIGEIAESLLSNRKMFEQVYRTTAADLHPDAGGDHEQFVTLQAVAKVLRQHHERSEG